MHIADGVRDEVIEYKKIAKLLLEMFEGEEGTN